MEYFFILGRNPFLSKAEIFLYLETRRIEFEEIFFERNFLTIRLKEEFNFNIQEFGGIIKLGKLKIFSKKQDFLEYLEKEEVVPSDKFSYSIIGNIDENIFISKFKKERKKAFIKRARNRILLQEGEEFFFSNADFEIFALKRNKFFLGLVEQTYDSKIDEFIDMRKPVRREEFSISPRLSKIMINLSGLKKGNILFDPFCGVGCILIESLLKNIPAIGFDIDKKAIEGAQKNLEWLSKNFDLNSNYKIERKNSFFLDNIDFDGIVTEAPLGDLIKRKLSNDEKKDFLFSFERKIVPFLKKFKEKKKENSRIIITFPAFENLSLNIKEILDLTGLSLLSFKEIKFPIIEKRKNQFVHRELAVLY